MSEFTPGPWIAVKHDSDLTDDWWSVLRGAWDISHNRASEPGVVADAYYSAMLPEENAANARLIAAAPEMYNGILRIIDEHSHIKIADIPDWLDKIFRIINKVDNWP